MPKQCLINHDPSEERTSIYLETLNASGELQLLKFYVRAEAVAGTGTLFSRAESTPIYACEILGRDNAIASLQTTLRGNCRVYTLEDEAASKLKNQLESDIGKTLLWEFDLVKPTHRRYENQLDSYVALLSMGGLEVSKEDYRALSPTEEGPACTIM